MTTTDPRTWLTAAQERASKATEGPWETARREDGLAEVNTAPAHAAWLTDTTRPVVYEVVNKATRADGEFIAAARTEHPAMAAALLATLDLHAAEAYAQGPDYCEECSHLYPCPTVRAITTHPPKENDRG